MSAWYILNALGFYPMAPGDPNYSIGIPRFSKTTIHLGNKNTFTVEAENFGENNPYVQEVFLNDNKLTKPYIHHSAIEEGAALRFVMGPAKKVFWE